LPVAKGQIAIEVRAALTREGKYGSGNGREVGVTKSGGWEKSGIGGEELRHCEKRLEIECSGCKGGGKQYNEFKVGC
jgi:hypothetical protein